MKKPTNSSTDKFLVSFVIPVYNVELYLRETVDSLLVQTIGFEQHCEIILINDGSTDASEEICLEYRDRYPGNIIYIKQDNSGPGEARNKGFDAARGKYINPIDSDDKLSPDAVAEVCKFFDAHYEEIDVVGLKWELFEASKGGHPLNHKFTRDRVIDLKKEFTHIQSSVAPAFFKREALAGHRFNPGVGRYAEDGRFMGEFMMKREKIGVVVRPTYYYRKRLDQTSSQDKNRTDRFWYLETPKRAWYDLVEYAQKKTGGTLPKYVQYLIMYDLQWRFRQPKQNILNEAEVSAYKKLLYGLLKYIDDDVIVAVNNMGIDYKLFVLGKKHGKSVSSILQASKKVGGAYFFEGTCIYDMNVDKPTVHIEIFDVHEHSVVLEGYYTGRLLGTNRLELKYGDAVYYPGQLEKQPIKRLFLGETILTRNRFSVEVPISEDELAFRVSNESGPKQLFFHRYSYLSHGTSQSYKVSKGWVVSRQGASISVMRYSRMLHLSLEAYYLLLVAKRLRIKPFLQNLKRWRGVRVGETGIIPDNNWATVPLRSAISNAYTIGMRLLYYTLIPLKRREIWLVSDRIKAADDSGEILFRYVMKRAKKDNINAYFTISKKSKEYDNIAKIGPTLDFGGFRHKLFFLLSDKIISSEAVDPINNVFGPKLHNFVDLYTFDFVFLQHGIIRDDISAWLNKYNKNIKMFVTSVKPEYKSIVEGDYLYDKTVVKLTGLPRYDNLRDNPKSKIILMPTWRNSLAGKDDPATGLKEYNPDFTNSRYYQFFHHLMNDKRLLDAMRRQGIKGEFYIHPSFESQTDDFKNNDVFSVMHMPHDYPKAKSEAKLMITDYSSVAFDFAYLGKPVLYSQFDIDTFYDAHISNTGYFTYEKDGFGPVARDLDSTIEQTIAILENDCVMEEKYQRRVEKFFAFNDKNNSARVYEEIRKL